MLGLELDVQRQSEGLHSSVLRVDQLVDGYRETEPRQFGSRVTPSPDDIRKGLAGRRGGRPGIQGVPQEARMSRGPVARRAGVLDEPWIHRRISRRCVSCTSHYLSIC